MATTTVSSPAWRAGAAALPRWLHAGAWWAWALGLAAAASRTTNPLLLLSLVGVAALVVSARRPDAPWARSFAFFLRLGLVVVIVRVGVQVLFGSSLGSTLLLPLPGITLPAWLAGVRLGGDVMLEDFLTALVDGLRLAAILICVGAANALASPSRLLKSVPAVLYEVGVSVVVALTLTPALVADVSRLQATRRLRGRATTGPRAIAGAAVPVLEGALERATMLAAAMDARGYGRRGRAPAGRRRVAAGLLLAGLLAACVSAYGLVSTGTPAVLGFPMLALGLGASLAALAVSGHGSGRTRYRPDPWWLPEWLVAVAGAACALCFAVAGSTAPAALHPGPATWPALPLLAVLGLLVAASPALTAPPLPEGARSPARASRERLAVAA